MGDLIIVGDGIGVWMLDERVILWFVREDKVVGDVCVVLM